MNRYAGFGDKYPSEQQSDLHSMGAFRLTPWHGADTLADVPVEPFIVAQFA